MKLTAISGNTLTVERGFQSMAVAHAAGAQVASHIVFFGGTWMLDLANNAPVVAGRAWRDDVVDTAAALGRGAHWLGRALGAAHVDGDLRWREFEHGLAVVNTGAVAATFTPSAGFTKLAGTQDATHNDGSAVTGALSIAAEDAYILARTN
ncbi:MAG TPA: hypothetical protein VGH63_07125 [Polyangia bacterium]